LGLPALIILWACPFIIASAIIKGRAIGRRSVLQKAKSLSSS